MKLDLQFFNGNGNRSGSGKGKGGGSASGELVLPDGSKIEFDGDLHFDGDDKALTGTARKNITDWEKKRVKNKIEYAYATDANGNPVGSEIRGSKGSVRVPWNYHESYGGAFTHIHPRGDGMLGGTFSGADLRNFSRFSNKTVRAAAKEGTYSISKGNNFDKAGFNAYVTKAQNTHMGNYYTKHTALGKDYKSGKISYNDYLTSNAKAFNTALVELHEAYRAGQKQYGYTYTLEKRG